MLQKNYCEWVACTKRRCKLALMLGMTAPVHMYTLLWYVNEEGTARLCGHCNQQICRPVTPYKQTAAVIQLLFAHTFQLSDRVVDAQKVGHHQVLVAA